MTVAEAILAPYEFAAANTVAVLVAAALFPFVATVAAWIGRGGRTDQDGVALADGALWAAAIVLVVGTGWFLTAQSVLGNGLLDMEVGLLAAPLVCFAGTFFGVTRVFPARRLSFSHLLVDVVAFGAALAFAYWFMSKFAGWGIIFFGGFLQLLVFFAIGAAFLWVLFTRVVRRRSPTQR